MREIKAGLNLVFGTLIGWLYFFLTLGIWLLLMIGASSGNVRKILGTSDVWWLLWCYSFPVWIGMSRLGAGYRSVLSCGGLFCVPRLTKSMKRFAIISGFILALMCALPLLLAKWPQEWERYAAAAIWFTLLAAAFLGGIPWPTVSKNPVPLMILILWLAIIFRLMFAGYLGVQPFDSWPAILAAGIFLCAIYCGPYTDKRIKSAQRQLACSTTDINERPQQAKLRITPAVERFFISRLIHCSQKHKYLWGAIYLCIATALSSWRQILLITLGIMAGSSLLYHKTSMGIIVFITTLVILSVCQNMKLPVHSQMLVAGGRRERFYGTLVAAISSSIVIQLVIILIAVISPLISMIIAMCVSVSFIPITMHSAYLSAYIAIGIVPLFFGLTLCFERAPLITGFVAALFLFATIFIIAANEINSAIGGLVPITLFVISCWAFLILVSWLICYKKDLILQTDKI